MRGQEHPRTSSINRNLLFKSIRNVMKITLADLENVAKALSIKVSYDDLKTSKGGSCSHGEPKNL
jgi:hypothetical protein